jgi:hypothetical protein
MLVHSPWQTVEGSNTTVLGKELNIGDIFITVQWLECIAGTREYELSESQDCIWEITSVMVLKSKLGSYKLPKTTAELRKSRIPYKLCSAAYEEIRYLS